MWPANPADARGPELAEAVNTLPLEPVTGIFHRYVKHLFVAESLAKGTELHIVTGEWARKSGGRFNFPNQYRVSYLALDGETASAEAERGLAAPFIHVFVSGSIRNVLRLDDGTVRSALELSVSDLEAEWHFPNARGVETPTQQLGRAAYDSRRVEAIAYPSTVHPGGSCLAVLTERLMPRSFLRILDPDGLLAEEISG